MNLRFAYNTNGAANHRLEDALAFIADAGYDGVALTLDHHHMDPFAQDFELRAEALAKRLGELKLGLVLETGARYLLNPRVKHEPTLLAPEPEGRALRVEFLTRAMRIAHVCQAEVVSFWAGVPQPQVSREQAWSYLREGVRRLLEASQREGAEIALEPEPGMLVETVSDYRTLRDQFPGLRLALDTGHCVVTGEALPEEAVRDSAGDIATVSIEDMRRGVHEHLPFGEGDMNVPAVLTALRDIGYSRLVCVELSRESHRAHLMIPKAIAYLKSVVR